MQVHHLATQFQGAVTLVNSPTQQEFKVPLVLNASSTPLFVKLILFNEFPQRAPIVQVLADVVHPLIEPRLFSYSGPAISEWTP